MAVSKEGVEITNRFFQAIDILKEQGRIRGLQTFTTKFEINRWNMNTVKFNPEISSLKPEWINNIVLEYGISADWIITGRGKVFGDSNISIQADESKLKVSISEIEELINERCVVKYTPTEKTKTAAGILRELKHDSKNDCPIIKVELKSGTIRSINVYSIVSMEKYA